MTIHATSKNGQYWTFRPLVEKNFILEAKQTINNDRSKKRQGAAQIYLEHRFVLRNTQNGK